MHRSNLPQKDGSLTCVGRSDRTQFRTLGGDDTLKLELANGGLIGEGLVYDGGLGGFDSLVMESGTGD